MNENKDNQDNKYNIKSKNWNSFLELVKTTKIDDDFLSSKERQQDLTSKDPFEDFNL